MAITKRYKEAMFEIVLDREYYSHSAQIFTHLKEMMDMEYLPWNGCEHAEGTPVNVAQIFGYTHVQFSKEEDRDRFEKWVLKL